MHSIFTAAQLSAALQILNTWYLYEMTIDIPYRYVDYVAKLWYISGRHTITLDIPHPINLIDTGILALIGYPYLSCTGIIGNW